MTILFARFAELSKAAHQNSVDHGFWDPAPAPFTTRALLHSEVSEALEDLRAGRPLDKLFYDVGTKTSELHSDGMIPFSVGAKNRPVGKKPNGIPSEIADVVIRTLDLAGRIGVDFAQTVEADILAEVERSYFIPPAGHREDPVFWLDNLHMAIQDLDSRDTTAVVNAITGILFFCEIFARHVGKFDLLSIVEEKMAYNASRPHKHGGKKF